MRKITLFFCTLGITVLSAMNPVSADMSWTINDTVTDSDGTTVTRQTIHISDGRFAIETDDGKRFIIDPGEDEMTMIDLTEKTYATVSLSEMTENISSMQMNTDKMIEDALSQIPAEQRAQYEALIRQQMSGMEMPEAEEQDPVDFTASGKSETIAGYKASQYIGTDEDGLKHELWCSKEVKMDEIMSFYETISKIDFFGDMQTNNEAIEYGFPLRTVMTEDGFQQKSEVTDISFKKSGGDIFSVPAGFTETEFGF